MAFHVLLAINHLRLPIDGITWPAAPILLPNAARAHTARSHDDDRLVFFLQLSQFLIPRRLLLNALNCELASQLRAGVCRPHHLAKCLVPSAFHHHQVTKAQIVPAEQPRTARVDVVCARHLQRTAPILADQAPADGKGQMQHLPHQQAVCLRRIRFVLHSHV